MKTKTMGITALVVLVVMLVVWGFMRLQSHATTPTPLAAPQLIAPGNGSTLNDQAITLQWMPVTSVDHYQVEIDLCNHDAVCTDANVTRLGIFTSSTSQLLVTQLNAYLNINARWRVWAVDVHGKTGDLSNWRTFHAVHTIPNG